MTTRINITDNPVAGEVIASSTIAGLIANDLDHESRIVALVAAVAALLPSAPTSTSATSATAAINLSWSVGTGALSYQINRGTTSGAETSFATTTATTYSDTQVNVGTTYYYTITSVNNVGSSRTTSVEISSAPSTGIGTQTQVFADGFGTTATGTGAVASRADATTPGANYVISSGGAFPIVSGKLGIGTGNAGAVAFAATPATSANQYSQIVTAVVSTVTHEGVLVRAVIASGVLSNGYQGRYNPSVGSWQIIRQNAGAATTIQTVTATAPTAPYTLNLQIVGSTLTLQCNSTVVASVVDSTPLTAAGSAALFYRYSSSTTGDANQTISSFSYGTVV